MLLEDGDLLSCVDDPLVYGVWGSEVDHLAEDHTVVHLLVQVVPRLLDLELVDHVLVAAHVVVDPVGKGSLLLIEQYVDAPHIPFNLSKLIQNFSHKSKDFLPSGHFCPPVLLS